MSNHTSPRIAQQCYTYLHWNTQRGGDLIFSALDSGLSDLGSSPDYGHYVVVLEGGMEVHLVAETEKKRMPDGPLN